uniref:RxLR effector protein n=1 Tax=Phytophthora sojae TaxID=67593 RepID=G1FQX0_PHYSO|nr:Avh24.2 [Phytophthora sojae]
MRLPSTLLAASALALLASDSALAAVAGASEGTKVSTMAFPDLDVLAVSHSAKRSLHDNERVDEDDEERWAGAKLFSAAKLEQAMNDSKYAETLMMRWKRHGFDIEDTKLSLEASKLSKDPRLNTAKIQNALGDSNYAKTLFREWKTHDHESTDILKKLKVLGLRKGDGDGDKLFKNYASWLNVHYPDQKAKDLAKAKLLFEDTMLLQARGDVELAERLFRAWKTRGFTLSEVKQKLAKTLANNDGKLLKQYTVWINNHFPVKPTRS